MLEGVNPGTPAQGDAGAAAPAAQGGAAAPQQPNGFGAAGGQQGAGMGNNPLGALGRMLGNAMAGPPIVPGQFAQGPFAQPHQAPVLPPNLGFGPGQQPPANVVIHIQYQVPRLQAVQQQGLDLAQNPAQQAQGPQQGLQPPPTFAGFYGPGGQWQPWNVGGQGAPNTATPNEHASTISPTSQGPAVSSPSSPEPPDTSSNIASTSNVPSPTSTQSANSATDSTPTPGSAQDPVVGPREAAALAALRRNNGSTPEVPPRTPTRTTDVDASPSSATASTLPTPSPSEATSASGTRSLEIPRLIPLYHYGPGGSSIATPGPSGSHIAHSSSRHFRPAAANATNPRPTPTTPISPLGAQRTTQRPTSPWTTPSPRPYAAATAPVPPRHNLSESQLAIMDQMTREAIDERLRVLEGVSNTVYQCIDDLMRMRSSLPVLPSQPTAVATTPSTTSPEPASAAASTSNLASGQPKSPIPAANGNVDPKGKDREDAHIERTPASASEEPGR